MPTPYVRTLKLNQLEIHACEALRGGRECRSEPCFVGRFGVERGWGICFWGGVWGELRRKRLLRKMIGGWLGQRGATREASATDCCSSASVQRVTTWAVARSARWGSTKNNCKLSPKHPVTVPAMQKWCDTANAESDELVTPNVWRTARFRAFPVTPTLPAMRIRIPRT